MYENKNSLHASAEILTEVALPYLAAALRDEIENPYCL